jgi:hypothetical protein
MSECQAEFKYHGDVVRALEATISSERLNTYLVPAGFNRGYAIQLYVWNSRLSESLHLSLQTAEVTLRNAVHGRLCSLFGDAWPTDDRFRQCVPREGLSSIDKVIERIQKAKKDPTTGRIIAGLSFEFWTYLFASQYDRKLWQSALHLTFPNMPKHMKRHHLQKEIIDIKEIRNRVAHYEPIFRRDLSLIHTNIIRLIAYRCEETAAWVRHHSELPAALRAKPHRHVDTV